MGEAAVEEQRTAAVEASRPGPMARARWTMRIFAAAVLALPGLVPILAHYVGLRMDGLVPTGFIQYDMAYYMANAREAFDAGLTGSFVPSYGNPFSYRYDTAPVYFQPLIFAMGLTWSLTGAEPGTVFATFTILGAVTCAAVVVALFEAYTRSITASRAARRLALVSFAWGGGLLALSGLVMSLRADRSLRHTFVLDPFDGWWFLNLGRNMIFATEAFYHALFFGCIVAIVRGRYSLATALALVLSASHPFTGIELISVMLGWSVLERFILRTAVVPRWFPLACAALAAVHVGYYLLFLPSNPEHRRVMEQWSLPWNLPLHAMIPAYAIVGALAVSRMRTVARARAVLEEPRNRLLLVWFLAAFSLANHDLVIDPIQPLHFTGINRVLILRVAAVTTVGHDVACRRPLAGTARPR